MKMKQPLTFSFINPNTPAVIEAVLRKILLEKLLAQYAYPDRVPVTS